MDERPYWQDAGDYTDHAANFRSAVQPTRNLSSEAEDDNTLVGAASGGFVEPQIRATKHTTSRTSAPSEWANLGVGTDHGILASR